MQRRGRNAGEPGGNASEADIASVAVWTPAIRGGAGIALGTVGLLGLPLLLLGCRHRRQIQADMRLLHAGAVGAILPPANPKRVPVFHPWLGRNE